MSTCIRSSGLAGLGVLFAASVSFAATLKEVEKKIADCMARHKTVQYENTFTQDVKAQGFETKSEGKSTGEYKRKGKNVYLSRVDMKSRTQRKVQGQPEEKFDSTMQMIQDEKFAYTLSVQGDQKSAFKTKVDPKTHISPFDVAAMFKLQRKSFDLALLPDETVDKRPVYVIQANPKQQSAGARMTGKSVTYYDKKNGMALKTVAYDASGKVMMTSLTTKVKLDGDISDERFVFKAPPGVQVIDATQTQGQPQPAAGRASKSETKTEKSAEKPAESAKEEKKSESKPKKKKKRGLGGLLDKLK